MRLYGKLIKEISEYPLSTLRIHSAGEPLLWEDLPEALESAYGRGVRSWIFTCGVTDKGTLLDALCKNTHIVEVSVNSITQDDYKATKGVDAFGLVVENIKYMRELIEKGSKTRLIVSRVQSADSDTDQAFVKYWKSTGLVDDAFIRSYHSYNDLMPELAIDKMTNRHEPCLVHWGRFNISVDGHAVVCFNELFKKSPARSLLYGDLNHQTITEIWRGPKLNAVRMAELSGDYTKLPFGEKLPCEDCYSCQPLYGSSQTSEYQIRHVRKDA